MGLLWRVFSLFNFLGLIYFVFDFALVKLLLEVESVVIGMRLGFLFVDV